MNIIWKYPIEITRHQTLSVPAGSGPIHAGKDPQGAPCIWVEFDDSQQNLSELVEVFVIGTGERFKKGYSRHIGSFVEGDYVWHVYTDKFEG